MSMDFLIQQMKFHVKFGSSVFFSKWHFAIWMKYCSDKDIYWFCFTWNPLCVIKFYLPPIPSTFKSLFLLNSFLIISVRIQSRWKEQENDTNVYECLHNILSILSNGILCFAPAGLHSTVRSASDWRSWHREFESQPCHITFVEIAHKIISAAILPLPLIQEGQLSVTGENIYTKYWLMA